MFYFHLGEAPDGVFLESGFNNILDAATYHPMASVYPPYLFTYKPLPLFPKHFSW